MRRALDGALPVLWVAGIALACTSALVLAEGGSPAEVYRLLLAGTWGNAYGIGQVLFKATPLIFTGLSVALALKAGLFNVGAEGQLTVGAFATAIIGTQLPASTPGPLAVVLCLAGGLVGGAVVGLIPGILKARRGAHEVITTIMLNFIVRATMLGIGLHSFQKESLHTAPIVEAAWLPRLSAIVPVLSGSASNLSLFLALAAVAWTAWLLQRSRAGFRLRAVGESPGAAETAGISVGRTVVLAMTLAGALAGLVGSNFVLGYKHYYEDGFSGGVGYMGIAVAVLAGGRPVGVIAAALLFGTLSQGALAVNAIVPKEIVDVLQAVIIFAVAGVSPVVRRQVTAARAIRAGKAAS